MANRTGLEGIQDRLPLGQVSAQPDRYDPSVLVPVPRSLARSAEGVDALSFTGHDVWNAWEISWLNPGGCPEMRIGQLVVPAQSPNLVESKSLKLYLNSFANERLSETAVQSRIEADLSACIGVRVGWTLFSIHDPRYQTQSVSGICLDTIAIDLEIDRPDPAVLQVMDSPSNNTTLWTDLFRSNCPVTGQPDWATVVVQYSANVTVIPATVLAYLVSYRLHTGFHEACIERIFCDLRQLLNPDELIVWAGFLRRGGLDINPVRSLVTTNFLPPRLARH